MLKIIKDKLKKNLEIFGLVILVIFTSISTTYFNYKKKIEIETYNNFIENIYFNKTIKHIVSILEPKFKKIKHRIKSGETFDKILESYSIDKKQIIKIKNSLEKKINLNKLNTKQILYFSIDKTNNKIDEFTFQISNTQKIYLKRNIESDNFSKEIISIQLEKKIVFKENIILQSLYKSASDESIPPNTIIEFARIYGFQVDFQRDVRKNDKFQILYEIYLNEKNEIVETGEILFANLELSGQDKAYITLITKVVKDITIRMEKV